MSDTSPGNPPDRRKHGYVVLETKADEKYDELEKRFDKKYAAMTQRLRLFYIGALGAVAVIGVSTAFGVFGFNMVLAKEGKNSASIQRQRYSVTVDNCEQQNKRHNNAIKKAEDILPTEELPIVRLLVDELQPFEKDCDALAKERVRGNLDTG